MVGWYGTSAMRGTQRCSIRCTHFDRGTAQFYDPAKAKTISLSPDQFRGDFKAIHFPK